MHGIRTIDDSSFDAEVLEATRPVLVDFTATWCPPCRALAPVLLEIAKRAAGRMELVSVDCDASPELAVRFGIRGFPTVVAFEGGRERARHVGLTSAKKIESLLGL